jgi:hypothetical protein
MKNSIEANPIALKNEAKAAMKDYQAALRKTDGDNLHGVLYSFLNNEMYKDALHDYSSTAADVLAALTIPEVSRTFSDHLGDYTQGILVEILTRLIAMCLRLSSPLLLLDLEIEELESGGFNEGNVRELTEEYKIKIKGINLKK